MYRHTASKVTQDGSSSLAPVTARSQTNPLFRLVVNQLVSEQFLETLVRASMPGGGWTVKGNVSNFRRNLMQNTRPSAHLTCTNRRFIYISPTNYTTPASFPSPYCSMFTHFRRAIVSTSVEGTISCCGEVRKDMSATTQAGPCSLPVQKTLSDTSHTTHYSQNSSSHSSDPSRRL